MSDMQLPPSDQSDKSVKSSTGILSDVLAGIALGALVGLLVGLSASPVISSVIAAFLALLGTFFGFGGSIGALAPKSSAIRIASFGLAMAVAFPSGIALRSYGTLGPSFHDRFRHFQLKDMDPARAYDLAIYEYTGLRTGYLTEAAEVARPPASSPLGFNQLDDGADLNCALLDARYMPAAAARLEAMARSREPWASFGRIGKALPTEYQADFAETAFQDRCKQGGSR